MVPFILFRDRAGSARAAKPLSADLPSAGKAL